MRIWDLEPQRLCNRHLLGEHRELHAIWNVLTLNKKGYSKHPETLRWRGKLMALFLRHEAQIKEMDRRGFKEMSPLDKSLATGKANQDEYVDTPAKQREILKAKGCRCLI
jgi:hypothetical protein